VPQLLHFQSSAMPTNMLPRRIVRQTNSPIRVGQNMDMADVGYVPRADITGKAILI
jgi:hypothetical protein